MLRTFAALSLGTLAATTAVASIASSADPSADRGAADATPRPAVRPMLDVSVAAKTAPEWQGSAVRLIDEGILDELAASAARLSAPIARQAVGVQNEIRPAIVVPKKPNHEIKLVHDIDGNIALTGRIQLKFRDGVGARASMAGITPVLSMTGQDVAGLNRIVQAEAGTVRQMIQHPEAVIEGIRQKAFERSGRVQPDLAAMMFVELPGDVDWDRVLKVARDINDLPEIEWVSLERTMAVYQQADCDPGNPVVCNRPNPGSGPACWDGDVTSVAPWPGACNPAPGDDVNALTACADAGCCDTVATFAPWCSDADSGQGWDVYCAAVANVVCQGTVYDLENPGLADRYDPCLSNYNPDLFDGGDLNFTDDASQAVRLNVFSAVAGFVLDTCFDPHVTPGCSIPACCASICVIDPTCCTDQWDQQCVDLATNGNVPSCEVTPVDDETPNFSELTSEVVGGVELALGVNAFQTALPFNNPFDPVAGDPNDDATFPRFSPFIGSGTDLEGGHAAVGIIWRLYGSGAVGGNAVLPNPTMVWMDGAEFEVVPAADCTTGDCIEIIPGQPRTYANPFPAFAVDASYDYSQIRLRPTGNVEHVAVCEFSAFVNHEEWCRDTPTGAYHPTSIIVEEGQTLSYLDIGNANHGLACLGATVAPDNDFGVIGMAPRAQGYFYPIVSIEEGSRNATAMASMIRDLPPGAVINHSWGPTAVGECLTANDPEYTLIRASVDAGLVVCIAAGNEGAPLLPEANIEVYSGAVIVGAREPGLLLEGICNRARRIFFSNFSSDDLEITVNAWGIMGATPGYGVLWAGEDTRANLNFVERTYTRSYTGPTPGNSTGGFNGTSFASPQVAGGCALIQGAFRMFWDTTVNGDTIGGLLAGPPGNCQTLGYPDDCPLDGQGLCGDILPPPPADPGGVITDIGPNLNVPGGIVGALSAISDPSGGSFDVYTGSHIRGNSISLSQVDNNSLVIRSEYAAQGPGPNGLVYYGTGPSIDFGLSLSVGAAPADIINLDIQTVSRATNTVVVEVVFARNFISSRWVPQGVELLTTQFDGHVYPLGFDIGTEPYIDAANRVSLRVYALGLGFVNGGGYNGEWDLVTVVANTDNEPL